MSQDKQLRYENYIYEPQIETVLFNKISETSDPVPILSLNSPDQLQLVFDELKPNNDFFQYTVIHCDANWNPSNLLPNEYLKGTFYQNINQYKYSTNTYQTYTNYQFSFPHSDFEITKSGNYLLKVFRNFDEADLIITRRMMILNNKLSIEATAKPATQSQYRYTSQEIDFVVDYNGYQIPNPFIDIKTTVLQNYNWSTAKTDLKPQFVNNNTMNFNYEEENVFDGINEFRMFDIRSLRFLSLNVADKYVDSLKNVVLKTTETRSNLAYVFFQDYNGKRFVQNKDGNKQGDDIDYALVHFTLKNPGQLTSDVYVFGEFTDWRLQDKYKMKWDDTLSAYTLSVKLKQSHYNYLYVQQNEDGGLNFTQTEGNHYETENDYDIFIYHKNQAYGYDELIGYQHINSGTTNR